MQIRKALICKLGSNPHICKYGVNPGIHKQLHKAVFQSFPLCKTWPVFSGPPFISSGPPFISSGQKPPTSTNVPHQEPSGRRTKRQIKKSNGIWPRLLDLRIHQRGKNSLVSFSSCKLPVMASQAAVIAAPATEVSGGYSMRKWRKRREIKPSVSPQLYLSFKSLFFTTWARSRGFFWIPVNLHNAYFQVSGCTELRLRDTEV